MRYLLHHLAVITPLIVLPAVSFGQGKTPGKQSLFPAKQVPVMAATWSISDPPFLGIDRKILYTEINYGAFRVKNPPS